MARIKIALFGMGRIGKIHFVNMLVSAQAQVIWVVEPYIRRTKEILEQYDMSGKVKVTQNGHEALSDPSVDAVMICTHHQIHAEITKQALKAGKAVFCEKPLSLSIEETIECFKLAKECELPLMCAFNRRFDPQIRSIYTQVKNGEIGTLRTINICCRDSSVMTSKPYLETSGGIFLDAMIHQIDTASFILDETAETIYATGHAYDQMFAEMGDIDTAMVVLNYPSGAVATLEFSRDCSYGYSQRLEVFGSSGSLEGVNQKPVEVLNWHKNGCTQSPIYQGIDRYNESFKLEVEYFINVLKGISKLEITDKSVISAGIIATACKESLDTQQVINVSRFAQDKYNYIIK